ncbi:MAG: ATP-binding protein [Candidatus Bipolaricaulia bacterium]
MTWTVRTKILLANGTVLLLLGLVLAWALANIQNLGSASEAILSENYRSIIAAENMINGLERMDSAVLLHLQGREQGLRQFRTNQNQVSRWLARAQDNITIEEEPEVLARIDSTFNAYTTRFDSLLQNRDVYGDRPYDNAMLSAFKAVRRAAGDLRDLNQQTMVEASDRAERVATRAIWSVGGIGVGAILLGLVVSVVLAGRIVRPIRKVQAATQKIAEGNYDVEVQTDGTDELGKLADQFNEMAAELRHYRDLNVETILAEQQKNEAILQSIDDGLLVVDGDYAVLNMNPTAEWVLGVSVDEAEGRHVLEALRNERLFDQICETIESGERSTPSEPGDTLTVEREGDTRHFQFVVNPVRDAGDEMLAAILLLRDVTELQELNRLKSEFVATASHELKTPLTSIGMSVRLLRERRGDVLDERDRELLDAAAEDVDRLRDLVDDLLDLSKIESGRMEMDVETIPVSLMCDKAIEALQAQAEENDISFDVDVPDDLPDVQVDPNKVTWVLNNLLSNALRYSEPGDHVQIRADTIGDSVRVSVEDEGAGIPYEYQSKIFDKFVQVDSDQAAGGTGLGLAISQEIIHAHGGRIWVDSTPGEGSTFTFTLPVAGRSSANGRL